MQKSGMIIILNGASASGKSMLQKELQKLFSEPCLGLGIDKLFVDVLPERFVIGSRQLNDVPAALVMEGIPSVDVQGNRLFVLHIGAIGDRVMSGMHHAIGAYARAGNNCIVDYIAYKAEWITDLVGALKGIQVYLVGVDCSLEELEKREKARGRSFVEGHARSHYLAVHEHVQNKYDVRVDTSITSAQECAKQIMQHIQGHMPSAFMRLI
jgi:chloramphenicol 3-O phosphotransferase